MPASSFVGRDQELADVASALERHSLVSLIGPGGAGKTRLAMAVAQHIRHRHRDGASWVDLAALDDPSSLPRALARALEVREAPGRGLTESVITQLADREALVILDNCEHLRDACADLLEWLMPRCPGLRVLTTSREPLGLPGELAWQVPSLSVPHAGVSPRAEELTAYGAIRLFCERAATAWPGFVLDDGNADAVVRICRGLDGIPLAIELATARLRVLSVHEIADMLDERLQVLVADHHAGPARHQTLRATLDWSYRLLSEAERGLLAELAVFQGGFTLDAVESVHRAEADSPSTLELISRLVDRSLISVARRGRQSRYRLLETVRLYAEERLAESADFATAHAAHARYYMRFAEQAEPELTGAAQREWIDRLEREAGNILAALRWSVLGPGEPEVGLRTTAALWRWCYLRGYYTIGREWLDAALERSDGVRARFRARALAAAGNLSFLQCEYQIAVDRLEAALARYQELDDPAGIAAVLQSLGCVARERGEYRKSRALHEASLNRWRHLDDEDGIARSLNYLGFAAWLQGDFDRAERLCAQALESFRRSGDYEGIVWSLLSLGASALYRGDPSRAEPLFEEGLTRAQTAGFREGISWSRNGLALIATRRGDLAEAARLLRESLCDHWALGDRWRTASVLEALAAVATRDEDPAWPARLVGAADALRATLHAPVPPVEEPELEQTLASLTERSGDAAFRSAYRGGQVTAIDVLIQDVLTGTQSVVASAPATGVGQRSLQPAVEITAFGAAEVRRDGVPVSSAEFSYAKPRELLYYLLDHSERTKGQIGAALWPWASASQLRSNFHTSLHHLRAALGGSGWITFTDGKYSFNRSLPYRYDVAEFEAGLARARTAHDCHGPLSDAVSLYRGDFLADLSGEAWIPERRAELRRLFENALISLGRSHRVCGHHHEAVETFRRAVEHDPLMESAHRELMRSYAAAGEPGRAVRHFQTLVRLLRDELSASPAPETVELLTRIRNGEQL